MDYKKTSVLLKKIKSLHNTLMDNEDQPSAIEQQLMKSYLRDFFDSFVSGEGATDIFNVEKEQLKEKTVPVISSLPATEIKTEPSQVTNNIIQEAVEPTQLNQTQNTVHTDHTSQVNGVLPSQESRENQDQNKTTSKEADSKTDIEMVVEGKEVIKQLVNNPVDADLLNLFNEAPVTDLSDKLALLPINDLTKALSINERFFTIQELFGGNSDLFQTTLKKLNSLSNFEEASEDLISSVASEYQWASTAKQKKAANFIKLVRRRYQ